MGLSLRFERPIMNNKDRIDQALWITKTGIWGNMTLVFIKFAAGFWGRSSALIADAVHSLSDFASDIMVIAGLKLGNRPADRTHHYGHGKFETLSAVLLGLLLILTATGLAISGGGKIFKILGGTIPARPGWIAVLAALLSISVKEVLYRFTIKTGKKIDSPAVIANAVHHRSDALSSIGAMIGVAGAILFGEDFRILDPLASIVVSFFILKASLTIVKQSLNELLESSLDEGTEQEIMTIITRVPGVNNPHNLRTRKIGNNIALDIHIEVDSNLNIKDAHAIALDVEKSLEQRYGPGTVISIHTDPQEEGD